MVTGIVIGGAIALVGVVLGFLITSAASVDASKS